MCQGISGVGCRGNHLKNGSKKSSGNRGLLLPTHPIPPPPAIQRLGCSTTSSAWIARNLSPIRPSPASREPAQATRLHRRDVTKVFLCNCVFEGLNRGGFGAPIADDGGGPNDHANGQRRTAASRGELDRRQARRSGAESSSEPPTKSSVYKDRAFRGPSPLPHAYALPTSPDEEMRRRRTTSTEPSGAVVVQEGPDSVHPARPSPPLPHAVIATLCPLRPVRPAVRDTASRTARQRPGRIDGIRPLLVDALHPRTATTTAYCVDSSRGEDVGKA